jgi:hypothetical protein
VWNLFSFLLRIWEKKKIRKIMNYLILKCGQNQQKASDGNVHDYHWTVVSYLEETGSAHPLLLAAWRSPQPGACSEDWGKGWTEDWGDGWGEGWHIL